MESNRLIATLILFLSLSLTGCGATDSGHADSQSANTSNLPDSGQGSDDSGDTNAKPVIDSQPSSIQTYEGESFNLNVNASGQNLTYDWEKAIDNSWVPLGQHGPQLEFPHATVVDSGLYRVKVTNGDAHTYSEAAEVLVKQEVQITVEPNDVSLVAGTNASLSVEAQGHGPLSYSWYRGNIKLNESSKYIGVDSPVLIVKNTSASDEGQYKAVVSNSDGSSDTSRTANINVVMPVSIAQHPANADLILNNSGSLQVTAYGSGPLNYTWQKQRSSGSWQTVSSGNQSTLYFNNIQSNQAGTYRVIVNNAANAPQTSQSATVTVTELVSINQQPSDNHGDEYRGVRGETVSFTVEASGTNVSYSWYKGDNVVANGNRLSLSNLSTNDAGIYRCLVTNSVGSQWCNPIELVILTPPAISNQSGDISLYEGKSASLSIAVSGSPIPTIRWFKDGNQLSETSNRLDLGSLSLDEEGTYSCEVSNEAGSVNCSPIEVEVKEIVRITKSPSNQFATAGDAVSLSVTATGEPPLQYQWYKDGQLIASGTDEVQWNITNVSKGDEGTYRVTVSNQGSSADSNSAQLTVFAPNITKSVRLNWSKPTLRADGSPLEDESISGYRVYHSTSLDLSTFEEIAYSEGCDNTSAYVENLEIGQHYFAITTIDDSDNESELSNPASVVLSN